MHQVIHKGVLARCATVKDEVLINKTYYMTETELEPIYSQYNTG